MANRLNKNNLDVTQVFLTYVALVGDIERTALALDIDPEQVRKLAESEGWQTKIERVCLMSRSGKPGDWERAQNRALCFVQAHQLRQLMDKMMQVFQDKTPEEIADLVSTHDKNSNVHVSARFFADLAAATEKAHQMSYAALGDTAGERKDRTGEDSEAMNATALHAAVIAALNNPAVKQVEVVTEINQLQDAQVKQLGNISEESVTKCPTSETK